MTDAFGLLGLLFLFLAGGKGGGGSSAPAPRPSGGQARQLPPAPAPWPVAVPEGLPTFPGPGWEYDEPPPLAVKQRAQQLVSPLWRQGKGSHRTEYTAGRWITYRAEIVRSGKQGVVAYRTKPGASTQRPPPAGQATAPSSPSSPSSPSASRSSTAMSLPMILTSTSPGWPQPSPQGAGVVQVTAGRWYQWAARLDGPPGMAQEIAKGLALGGAVNIAVSTTPPYIVAYQLLAKHSVVVPLGVRIKFSVAGVELSITFLEGREIEPPSGPKMPMPPGVANVSLPGAAPGDIEHTAPGGSVFTRPAERSALDMPDLKIGARGEDVKIVQRKLRINDDGIFGKGTQTAVIQFQQRTGLAPANQTVEQLRARGFGAVKQATWVKLFGVRA